MPPEGSLEITTSIGGRCKARKGFSRSVLICREAWLVFVSMVPWCEMPASQLRLSNWFGVAMAEGIHLFPFRTEKLSPLAPMVLGGQPPGRVGSRRLSFDERAAVGGLSSF